MRNNSAYNTPPVIRVFLSSTFADMDKERSYFNEVLAPKIGRICAERGVSFFSVDLRWGITKEDQINGQVLPICLNEIDKCRPYFIGMIGNRYGSVLETVPPALSLSIPWLKGKEGHSITELEMMYAVLDHNQRDFESNAAFYLRSDRLSKELYGGLKLEEPALLSRLDQLKSRVEETPGVPIGKYDTIEEFGDLVMRDMLNWLDINFPKSAHISDMRRKWYDSEILRNYIDCPEMTDFLDSYIGSSRRPLLLCGDGARGKTTYLTAWTPAVGKKILINCGSDDKYSYWPAVAREIISSIHEIDGTCELPDMPIGASMFFQFVDFSDESSSQDSRLASDFYFVTDAEREKFQNIFVQWMEKLQLRKEITVVINDLHLLEDEKSKTLAWLPASIPENLNIICTSNDKDMEQTVKFLGWNIKEVPCFETENAKKLTASYLHSYGKKLSDSQFKRLMSSVVTKYPGQLRFVIMFLINHGRFDNLDRLIERIALADGIEDVYRYVYDYLTGESSEEEIRTVRNVLGLVRYSNISLSERECFELSQQISECTSLAWSRIRRIFEQFDIVKGDYWNLRNEELQKFADQLLSPEEQKSIHGILGAYFFGQLKINKNALYSQKGIRYQTAYAKEALFHFRNTEDWEKLADVLSDRDILYYLCKVDWYCVRAAWMKLFLDSDFDIPARLMQLIRGYKGKTESDSQIVFMKLSELLMSLGYQECRQELYRTVGMEQIDESPYDVKLIELVSEDFISEYNEMVRLKSEGKLRQLQKYAENLLKKSDTLNTMDRCQILCFKSECEMHMGLRECISTANDYYTAAIKTGMLSEISKALIMRGNALYRNERYPEVMEIQQKVLKIALNEGFLRDYLAAKNIVGMCCYRAKKYDTSIAIFDEMMAYWQKLSYTYEVCTVLINKCNALSLKGCIREALEIGETFYEPHANDDSMKRIWASLLGNLGHYAHNLKLYEKAERYLLQAVIYAKEFGQEGTLKNAYHTLMKLHIDRENITGMIETSKDQMEFLWEKRDYSAVTDALREITSRLRNYRYFVQADQIETLWKEKFSEIPGGTEYFEKQIDTKAVDRVKAEKLREEIMMAKSEGNIRKQAEKYSELAEIYERTDKQKATEHYLSAALLYRSLNDREHDYSCIESALMLQFDKGKKISEALCKKVIRSANDGAVEEISALWESLEKCESAKTGEQKKIKKKLSLFGKKTKETSFYELLCCLFLYPEKYEFLKVRCLMDFSKKIVRSLTAEEIIGIVEKVLPKYRKLLCYQFEAEIMVDYEKDHSSLIKDYLSPFAMEIIEFHEKCIAFLKHFDMSNAAVLAGNIAVVFRRRKDKEKTLRYHTVSMETYKKLGKTKDYFIEKMNLSTAFREFGETEKAIKILRTSLAEAEVQEAGMIPACIAGNLASLLISCEKTDYKEEILRCFDKEESYFRSIGNERDLTISLLNQIMYLSAVADPSEWKYKLDEAGILVRKNGFKEFMSVLNKLEWATSEQKGDSGNGGEALLREKIGSLFASSSYTVSEIRRDKGIYEVVCAPSEKNEMGLERLHVLCSEELKSVIHVAALYQLKMYRQSALPEITRYVDWWNTMGQYSLTFDESKHVLIAHIDLAASDWTGLAERFDTMMCLWEADKVNLMALMFGLDFSMCQGMKLKHTKNN